VANSVAHFEIFASDLTRARTFYTSVFGWKFQNWGPPDFFLIFTGNEADPGVKHGALAKRNGDPPTDTALNAFRCSISVVSAEASMAAIKKAGGKLRSPLVDIPNVGKVVEFADTEGNIACIVEYDPRTGLSVK
jgi:predicted enzyme related to lactoylglutathione lyase